MTCKLEWLPAARDDLVRLYEFIKPHNPEAAARAVQTIVSSAGKLEEQPELGWPYVANKKFRELFIPFGASQYVLRYRLDGDKVIIARLWHGLEARE